jgi:hypothetical protein
VSRIDASECLGIKDREGNVVHACNWTRQGKQAMVVAAVSRHGKDYAEHLVWLERTQSRVSWGADA